MEKFTISDACALLCKNMFTFGFVISIFLAVSRFEKYWTLTTNQDVLLATLIFAPIFEELGRKCIRFFTFTIIAFETVRAILIGSMVVDLLERPYPHYSEDGPTVIVIYASVIAMTLLLRLPANTCHVLCRSLPYHVAVVTHCLSNATITLVSIVFGATIHAMLVEWASPGPVGQLRIGYEGGDCTAHDWRTVRLRLTGMALSPTEYACCITVAVLAGWFANRCWTTVKLLTMSSTADAKWNRKNMRNTLSGLTNPTARPMKNHPHGLQAAERGVARTLMKSFCAVMGLNKFEFQMSAPEMDRGATGNRVPIWPKDLTSGFKVAAPLPKDVICMTDVDYYLDMNQFTLDHEQPILMSTYMLQDIAVERKGYMHTFNEDGEMLTKISGGGTYQHKLWNYNVDTMSNFGLSWWSTSMLSFTFWWPTLVYDMRNVDSLHRPSDKTLTLLTPGFRTTGFAALITWLNVDIQPLLRLSPVGIGGFVGILVLGDADGAENYISCAPCGAFSSFRLPVSCFDGLSSTARMQKTKLSIAAVAAAIKDTTGSEPKRILVAGLTEYIRSFSAPTETATDYQERHIHAYSPCPYDEEAALVLAIFQPLIDSAYSPRNSKANEKASVEHRVARQHSDKPVNDTTLRWINEFVSEFVKDSPTLRPTDEEDVSAHQPRPMQQQIFESFLTLTSKTQDVIMTFMKGEAYANLKPARTISTLDPDTKIRWSQFMYPLGGLLKTFGWYAFGKVPLDIAEHVTGIAQVASEMHMTDYTRMDGTVSETLRALELALMLALFPSEYHAEIVELASKNHHCKAKGRFGTTYETLWSRLSGSPETSSFNTICTKFNNFVARRLDGHDVMDAFDATGRYGMFGGDDGLATEVTVSSYETSARMLGLKLKCDTLPRGASGVNFLARFYGPNVWYGDSNSCTDPARALSKLHTTHRRNTEPRKKLLEKCRAIAITDAGTPILGQFALHVLDEAGELPGRCSNESWWSRYDVSVQFPNNHADWMDDLVAHQLPDLDHVAVERLMTKSIADILSQANDIVPTVEPKPTDFTAYVQGYVIPAKREEKTEEKKTALTRADRSKQWREKKKENPDEKTTNTVPKVVHERKNSVNTSQQSTVRNQPPAKGIPPKAPAGDSKPTVKTPPKRSGSTSAKPRDPVGRGTRKRDDQFN